MSTPRDFTIYDDVLMSILVKEESILNYLAAIFSFLARRTDFYYVPKSPDENMGFPQGVAEQLVLKVVRACDPKNWINGSGPPKTEDVNNEIMCSTVAQEVEVVTDESNDILDENSDQNEAASIPETTTNHAQMDEIALENLSLDNAANTDDFVPPRIPYQSNSESYNGAVREKYSWAQTITDLDMTVRLPSDIKSSKDLRVVINTSDIVIHKRSGEIIIQDRFPFKIRASESFWSITEGKLLIHFEKLQERWWKKLLEGEEELDLDKIDCSRPLYELSDDHIEKVNELKWNQERKLRGLPTSDEMRNIEILRKACKVEGSPFKNVDFELNEPK